MLEIITNTFSKKLTLAFTSVIFFIATEFMGIDISFEKLLSINTIVVTYIIGQSFIDVKKLPFLAKLKKTSGK